MRWIRTHCDASCCRMHSTAAGGVQRRAAAAVSWMHTVGALWGPASPWVAGWGAKEGREKAATSKTCSGILTRQTHVNGKTRRLTVFCPEHAEHCASRGLGSTQTLLQMCLRPSSTPTQPSAGTEDRVASRRLGVSTTTRAFARESSTCVEKGDLECVKSTRGTRQDEDEPGRK